MDSPTGHLLGTNAIPSDAEARQINNFISQRSKDVFRLDDEIARIQAIVNVLSYERDKLQKDIDSHRALLSPARRLPREILQEIFISCLPTHRNAVMSARDVPVLLGQICSTWRTVSLSTAKLWSSLHIVIPNHPTEGPRKLDIRCDVVKMWLDRSGVCPLSISLVMAEFASTNVRNIPRFLEILVQFSQRWKDIEFKVPYRSLDSIADLGKDDIPLLESIKFHEIPCFPDMRGVSNRRGISILEVAPRLQSVCFMNFRHELTNLSLPWARLAELGMVGLVRSALPMDAQIALSTLRRCPNLEAFSVQLTGTAPVSSHPLEAVSHSKLQSLCVAENHSGDLVTFMDHLILPELRHLEIRGSGVPSSLLVPSLTLPFSTSPLLSLTLKMAPISENSLIEFLLLVPSLTSLSIVDWVPRQSSDPAWGPRGEPIIGDALVDFLMLIPGQGEVLCPALEQISFTECGDFSDEELLKFLQSRFKPVIPGISCLQRVEISLNREIEPDVIPHIRALREAGLHISLKQDHSYPGYSDYPWEGISDPLWGTNPDIWYATVASEPTKLNIPS